MAIEVKNLSFIYGEGTPFASKALDQINLSVQDGEVIGLIGHTGSGKSTLIQHFNGLLKASEGTVIVDGISIDSPGQSLKELRKRVGLVFQYPEYQLFEETIYKDIAFGPQNQSLGEQEVKVRVKEAMMWTGLDYETFKDRSPFELSGGQKRRVAIAGVIAMRPSLLILDEPTAGLDPMGREEMLDQIARIHQQYHNTIILVSHSMDEVAKLVTRLIVMNQGTIAFSGSPQDIFAQKDRLRNIGLDTPYAVNLVEQIRAKDPNFPEDIITMHQAKQAILKWLRKDKYA